VSAKYPGNSDKEGRSSEKAHYTTPGNILTPVVGFSNRVTGTPPKPQFRGDAKESGTQPVPVKSGRGKSGANNAMKAFGLQGKGHNDK
jgi:hypothetical protein